MKITADQNIPFVQECFNSIGRVQLLPGRAITRQVIEDSEILLVRSITKVNESLVKDTSVKFTATATIGTDHIDQAYLKEAGIGFASAPGSNANSVAEYVVAGLLALAKKKKFNLADLSIGIIGVGNVGSKVDVKCRGLGMKTVLNDPPLARQTKDAKYRPLEEVLDCDIVTMHTPLTIDGPDKTYHLADQSFFDNLKNGSIFINTSRGGVMDTAALKSAISLSKLFGVILDVFENEPNPDPELILKADLTSPHIAGYSYDGKVIGMIMIYNAACKYFGLQPAHTEADFLPEPEVREITITPEQIEKQTDQEIIHDTVQQVYVINRDDFNMREILLQPENEQGAFFDKLRKEYPVRREFQNTKVSVPDGHENLKNKLNAIGFTVNG